MITDITMITMNGFLELAPKIYEPIALNNIEPPVAPIHPPTMKSPNLAHIEAKRPTIIPKAPIKTTIMRDAQFGMKSGKTTPYKKI
jgi:hypothetical protein